MRTPWGFIRGTEKTKLYGAVLLGMLDCTLGRAIGRRDRWGHAGEGGVVVHFWYAGLARDEYDAHCSG